MQRRARAPCTHAHMHTATGSALPLGATHACMHARMHTYRHTSTHAYIQACMHACIHTGIHARMHTCIQARATGSALGARHYAPFVLAVKADHDGCAAYTYMRACMQYVDAVTCMHVHAVMHAHMPLKDDHDECCERLERHVRHACLQTPIHPYTHVVSRPAELSI